MMTSNTILCEVLSPVHIGTEKEINALEYVIRDGKLYKISFERFVATMDTATRSEFEDIIDRGNLVELRKFVAKRVTLDQDAVYDIEVSRTIERMYEDKFDDIRNQLLINPFFRTQDERIPVLPGSSFKGAIRTAILSQLAKQKKPLQPRNFREERVFEQAILGCDDAKSDPFRGLKIRDRSLHNEVMQIRTIENVSKKRGGPLGPTGVQMNCEVTCSMLTGKQLEFKTELIFDDLLFSSGYVSERLTPEGVKNACNAFYRPKMKMEHENFYKNSDVDGPSSQLLDVPFMEDSFLVRIGRFSGVESVTLDEYRNPRPPGRRRGWGSSRNLADGLYPMGWVKATFV
jgi:CRISPR-associated protein Csm5